MKKLILFLFIFSSAVSIAFGQACGMSKRHFVLEFEKGIRTPERVGYEMFYLAPKGTGADKNDYPRLAKFLSEFLYDNADAEKTMFWINYEPENPLLKIPADKAEKYIATYKLEDFKDFYTVDYKKHHLSQLKGEFKNGELELTTGETDITPFIMRIKHKGFETLYLLDAFLGGCFNNKPAQTIVMKRKTGS